jgi:membrane protease YdiL (CAAX protease family)
MTSPADSPVAKTEPFFRLEDPGTDFPFYNGAPTPISNGHWLVVMATVVVGFLVLALPLPWPGGMLGQLVRAIAVPAIPLAGLSHFAPGHWRAIFGKVGGREVKLMFAFALMNVFVSMVVGVVVFALAKTTPNGALVELGKLGAEGRVGFFAGTVPQLFGEEVITLLPFLAVLSWLTSGLGAGRKAAIVVAWLSTSLVFGLIHLPTYKWNWLQCIVVIGAARMVLTLPWIMTKNIWVSTGAHILNDWFLFSVTLLGANLIGKG